MHLASFLESIHQFHYNKLFDRIKSYMKNHSQYHCGKTYPISLENRLSIRPDGFVSKNRILVAINPLNMAS